MSKGRLKFVKRTDAKIGEVYFVEKTTCVLELAFIMFDPRWKKWVFRPCSEMFIFDSECLQQIVNFMNELQNTGVTKNDKST